MANRYCTRCGREALADKRFCSGCGKILPVDDAAVENEIAAAALVCGQCGMALTPGKRFCKQCGHPVDLPVELPKTAVPSAAAVSDAFSVIASSRVRRHWSKAKIGWAIGLATVVLVVAAGGCAWVAYLRRGASGGPEPVAPTQQTHVQSQGATAQSAKPSSGAAPVPDALRTAPQSALKSSQNSIPLVQPLRFGSSAHGDPSAPTPVFQKPANMPQTPLPWQTEQARSGVLHYQGPPVPHGGMVVFDKLPKARLKFTFDRTVWQLLIKLNPDGTKKVTLISLARGDQSSCDLGWEILE
jgi:hypothetical protein